MSETTLPQKESDQDTYVLKSPQWVAIFFTIAIPISVPIFLIGFMFNLSVAHDFVFGLYALLSGAVADCLIRYKFAKVLLICKQPRIPFIAFWIALCVYVMLFRPFM